jgi:hypothetical protein
MNQLDGLPKTIRIGPYEINIVLLPKEHEDCGNFNLGDGVIGLQGAFHSPTMAVDTFIHEVIHAACRIYGVVEDDLLEERICSGVAPVMTQIFLDHPEILQWMLKSLTKSSTTSPTT